MMRARLLLLVGGLCGVLLVGEGLLWLYRFFFISPDRIQVQHTPSLAQEVPSMSEIPGLFVPDPTVVHRYRRRADVRWQGVLYEINSQGWRGPDWPRVSREDTVVLCLGDSITFGYGISFEKTFCKQLEELLREKFPRENPIVLNAASDNYNTEQEVQIFKELLPIWEPDIVMVNFYRNDIYPNGHNVDDRGRLYTPQEAFPNTKSPSPSAFSRSLSWVRSHSLLSKFLEQRFSAFFSYWMLQFPTAFPRSQQVRYWQETEQKLSELVQSAHHAGVDVVFVYFPDRSELQPFKLNPDLLRFKRMVDHLQVPFVDIGEIFKRHLKEGIYLDSAHPTARGHEVVAFTLSEAIEPFVHQR